MSIGIYKITNRINNLVYIGQSQNIDDRWRHHRYYAYNQSGILYDDMKKFGLENFCFEIIEICSVLQLNEREIYWINFYNSKYPYGYNLTSGGSYGGHPVKISNEDIIIIYDLLLKSALSQKEIALRFNVGEDTISEINQGKIRVNSNLNYPIRKIIKSQNICIDCGKNINPPAKRCDECNSIFIRKVIRPDRETLKSLIRRYPFTTIGQQYKVSDNAIRKWCKYENLPYKSSDIKQYSDIQWLEI